MIFNYNTAMESTITIHHWLDLLQAAGCRVTAPRRAIVDLLATSRAEALEYLRNVQQRIDTLLELEAKERA